MILNMNCADVKGNQSLIPCRTQHQTHGNDTEFKDKDGSFSQDFKPKDEYLWKTKSKTARRAPRQNIYYIVDSFSS